MQKTACPNGHVVFCDAPNLLRFEDIHPTRGRPPDLALRGLAQSKRYAANRNRYSSFSSGFLTMNITHTAIPAAASTHILTTITMGIGENGA